MATLPEHWSTLYHISNVQDTIDERIEISFEILELYCALPAKRRSYKSNMIAVCGAATKISSIVKHGLSDKVLSFLEKHEHQLPIRAVQLLRGKSLQMSSL